MRRAALSLAALAIAGLLAGPAAAAAPKRVVTLTPFGANTLALLGKRPVGVGQTVGDRISPKLAGIPSLPLSHPNGPNMEQLAKLNPDLVLSSLTWRKGEQTMRSLDMRVVESEPYRLATLPGATRRLGELVGKPKRAAALARRQKSDIAAAKRGVKRTPRVMLVLGVGRTPFVFLSNSWGGDVIRQAGAQLLTSGLSAPTGFARISDEVVVQRNPEIIIAVPHGRPEDIPKAIDYLKSNPAWEATDAARNDRVYVSADNSLLQAYPNVANTIRNIQAKFLKNK